MKTPIPRFPPQLRAVLLAAAALIVAGCVSTKYRSAADHSATVPLNLAQTHRGIEATLETVIILNGPGAWKRVAYWDEYVVAVANRGRAGLTIESAELVDHNGRTVRPGNDPWVLEQETASWWHHHGVDSLRDIQRGVGGAGAAAALLVYGLPAMMAVTAGVPMLGAQVLAAGAVPIAVPTVLLLDAESDVEARRRIEDTFQARRLSTPRVVAPGQEGRGSLFFPITPGPRQLRLVVRAHGELNVITVDLTAISHLHGAVPAAVPASDRDPNDLRIVPATLFP